jgi:hypothetical protein
VINHFGKRCILAASAAKLILTPRFRCLRAQVLGTMQAVLKRTHEHAAQCLGKHSDNTCAAETAKARELQLIKSKCDIEAPPPLPESCDFTIL